MNSHSQSCPEILAVRPVGAEHQVVTVTGAARSGLYRREPCGGCPWRQDTVGDFPAEAFRLSAACAYDMSEHVFACHESGRERPAACAGFLLRGSEHNLAVRLGRLRGHFGDDVRDGGCALHASYRAMAVANGVEPADPVLGACRD